MKEYPTGKDKFGGEWKYVYCTTCEKPIKIYKEDCLASKYPKNVNVCKRCLPEILKSKRK